MTGKIFKQFREGKNLSTQAAAEIISPQFLRKYEKNQSDIRLTNLLQLLNRINVTIEEFTAEIENSLDYWMLEIESRIDQAYHAGNSFQLKKFIEEQEENYHQTKELRFCLIALVGQYYYNLIFLPKYVADLSPIKDYLRETESWGTFELFLVTYVSHIFHAEEAFLYAVQLLKKQGGSIEVQKWRYDAILHLVLLLLNQNHLEHAQKLMSLFFSHRQANPHLKFIHHDLYAKFVNGLLLIKLGEVKGKEDCERVIQIFVEDLGYADYGNRLNILYQTFI
ncbi:hypothetical protein NRIC_16170 [Enterococcus florum]|uniref:HTH cro/C1-type domain-containing protein n=1 Tax=Enterococcus florum TaxID=2480627 RepID=A0A4P5P876_9ENTE|nr:helix-turn-helix transcriptional regulator [Enterococcus florum]GCF93726.1 hypothetical protein NRIC_16170 [Enterococcus florum]